MILSTTFSCAVCEEKEFQSHDILWPELIEQWELSHEEVKYINEQQATACQHCHTAIRSGALAKAICQFVGHEGSFMSYLQNSPVLPVLEINEAGHLHPYLAQLTGHQLVQYPDCDLMKLSYPSNSFKIIIHSDTLEHVPDPKLALSELHRVLMPGGVTIFTVPIIHGRLNRNRSWLPPSYHGTPDVNDSSMQVFTEFGANIWCMILEAGFSSCNLLAHPFPSGIAITATK
jgi:SAM-dependent methyltransferase